MIRRWINSVFYQIKNDLFLKSSVVLFFGSLLAGVINYIYHFLMARLLSTSDYGELQSLLAVLSIVGIFGGSITLVMTKYTAEYWAKNEQGKIVSLLVVFLKKVAVVSLLFLVIFGVFRQMIVDFLHIDSSRSLMIVGVIVVIGFVSAVINGVLRGLQKFKEGSLLQLLLALLKLFFSLFFLWLGWNVSGALGAVLVASIVIFAGSFYPIRSLFQQKQEAIEGKQIVQYAFPVFISLLASTLLLSSDIVLVKHFFSSDLAGQYAALSMMGKVIYFVASPIAMVLFPQAADAHSVSGFPAKVLKKALLLTTGIGAIMLPIYFFFSSLMIQMMVGEKYLGMAPYLGWFALSVFVYSLVNLFANFFLSIGKTNITSVLLVGALLQICLLFVFHNSLQQIILVLLCTMISVLLCLVSYFVWVYYLCPKR